MITFDIACTADLQAVISEYTNLCTDGFSGRVELVVAPGARIGQTAWSLEPPMGASRAVPIDVAIVGNSGSLPLFDAIVARTVHIEDVVLTDRGRATVWVAQDFTMKHAMLVDVRSSSAGQSVIEILANGGHTKPTSVTFEEAWFVRNYQGPLPERLIHMTARGDHAGRFGAVRVLKSAFLGNAFQADVSVEGASRVEVLDSIFYRSWPGAGTELACVGCGELALRRSQAVLAREDQLAAVDATPFHKEQVSIAVAGIPDLDATITKIAGQPAALPTAQLWEQVRGVVHVRTSSHFAREAN